jgi:methyl-accepting chemotaxis protein
MSIKRKILTLVALLVLFTLAASAGHHVLAVRIRDTAAQRTSELLLQDYRNELKDLVDGMAASLAAAGEGWSQEQDLHRVWGALLRNARFFPDRSGYYFVYRSGGTVFILPTLPDLEGRNLLEKVDPNGTPYIRKLDQVAKGGGGYVEYSFDKPGKGVLPKLSYARMIPGTSYWVGTGVYVDDVETRRAALLAEIRDETRSFLAILYLVIGNAFLVIVVPLVGFLVVSILRPLRQLTHVAEAYSTGQLQLEVPGLSRRDEIGSLARALGRLGTSMKKALERLQAS